MKNPLFALLAIGIVAILASDQIPASLLHIKLGICSILLLLSAYKFLHSSKTILFTCIGLSFFTLHQIRGYFPNRTAQQTNPYYIVQELPELKKNNIRIKTVVHYSASHKSLPDYCLVYIPKNTANITGINMGDTIYTTAPLREIKQNIVSPLQFDYATYMHRRRIVYTLPLHRHPYLIKHLNQNNTKWIKNLQEYLNNCFQQYIPHKQNASLAASLIIGQKSELNPEILANYSKIGIIHLLSVSGLHVGIFLWLIQFLFSRFKQKKKYLQYATILSFLVLYTMITGASIPVIRCAIMFAFVETGKLFRRQSSILHALFGSALLLLLYNTQFLFDIGFQLSYLALIGIIVLHPFLSKKLFFPNKWIQQLYDMMCATLAAWVFTFPAVVFYFHNLSLLGNSINLIAIPLAACILYLGLLLILLSGFPGISIWVGMGINRCIDILNSIVSWSIHLPFSYIDNIFWNPAIILLQYAVILLMVSFLFSKKRLTLYAAVCCLMLINLQFILPKNKNVEIYFENQSMLLTMQNNTTLFYSTNYLNNQTQHLFQLAQSYHRVDSCRRIHTPHFSFNHHTYLLLDKLNYQIDSVDYLIIHAAKNDLAITQLNHTFVRKEIICHINEPSFQKLTTYLLHKKSKIKCTNAVKFATIQ